MSSFSDMLKELFYCDAKCQNDSFFYDIYISGSLCFAAVVVACWNIS